MRSLEDYFEERLKNIQIDRNLKAYIISVFRKPQIDLPSPILILTFAAAKDKQDFLLFQKLGDHVLFTRTFFPKLTAEEKDYKESIAQISYYNCYKLTNRKFILYEQLADQLGEFVKLLQLSRCGILE